jgi:hypothetical protein
MAKKDRIRVKVEPGTFSSERSVSFEVNGQKYNLIVDEEAVKDDTLEVYVIAINDKEDKALIDLPRETFTSGSRIFIPKAALLGT